MILTASVASEVTFCSIFSCVTVLAYEIAFFLSRIEYVFWPDIVMANIHIVKSR